jgi:hypothetical protein
VAVVSGFEPERVLRLYPFLPLMMAAGFALALYAGLSPLARGNDWSAWERVCVAGCATLLSSSPFEFSGIYRVPWAMTFLLKPNHALGLVLFPIVLAVFVRARGWKGRLAAGLVLHLLGWVFVLHMAYVAVGLAVFSVLSFVNRHPDRRRDALDVAVTLGVNFLIVSPYLFMLLVGYPFLVAGPMMTIAATSPHLLEVTARAGPIAALAIWGAICVGRRPDRLSRVWVAQLVAAIAIWVAYLPLSAVQFARERDEIYYWVRFLSAASAGIGAWDLVRRAAARWKWTAGEPALAAALAFGALPYSLPYWWDPSRMDPYFPGSLAPVEDRLRVPTAFLRRHTERSAVVLSDGDFARYAAALGGRRVLAADNFHRPADWDVRTAMQDAVLVDESDAAVRALAQRWPRSKVAAWYAVVTPQWLRTVQGVNLGSVRSRRHLEEVHFWGDADADFVAVFKVKTD